MPNTLVHLGVQGLVGRAVSRDIDLRLVYLGCIIPDLPWIAQRAVRAINPGIDRVDLALYSGAQSSLLFCLVLSAVLSCFSPRPRQAIAILSSGSLLHLLLDITQIKWGNGAIFLAPVDWRVMSLGWSWPEHGLFAVLTVASLGFVLFHWRHIPATPVVTAPRGAAWLAVVAGTGFYFIAPLHFMPAMLEQDVYDTRTLRDYDARTGKAVEFDRATLLDTQNGVASVRIFTGESLTIENIDTQHAGLISIRGRFRSPGFVVADEYRVHPAKTRDIASMVGLFLLAVIWIRALYGQWRNPRRVRSK